MSLDHLAAVHCFSRCFPRSSCRSAVRTSLHFFATCYMPLRKCVATSSLFANSAGFETEPGSICCDSTWFPHDSTWFNVSVNSSGRRKTKFGTGGTVCIASRTYRRWGKCLVWSRQVSGNETGKVNINKTKKSEGHVWATPNAHSGTLRVWILHERSLQ